MELEAQAAEGRLLEWIQRNALEAMQRKASCIDEDAPELHLAVYRQVSEGSRASDRGRCS